MIDPHKLSEFHNKQNYVRFALGSWWTRLWMPKLIIFEILNTQHDVLFELISEDLGLNRPTARALAPALEALDLTEAQAIHAQIHELTRRTILPAIYRRRDARFAFDYPLRDFEIVAKAEAFMCSVMGGGRYARA